MSAISARARFGEHLAGHPGHVEFAMGSLQWM
jgi:hypothetical protein